MNRALLLLVLSALPVIAAEPWPGAAYERVVGYTFANETTSDDEFTLLRGGKLNEAQLAQFKTGEVTLSEAQATRLVTATSSFPFFVRGAACYDPHHIFVFYDKAAKPVGAIEVCFGCQWVNVIPEPKDWQPDWAALAKLSWELGLGLGSPKATLKWYLSQKTRGARIESTDDAIEIVRRHITQHGGDPSHAEYRASRRKDHWSVTVWRKPAKPGAHTTYSIAGNGKIVEIFPGK